MAARKVDLRVRTLAARRQMTAAQRQAAGSAICEALLRLPEMSDVETVAAYVSIGSEPQTTDVIRSLRARGVRVLVPVLCPDLDLDWTWHDSVDRAPVAGRHPHEDEGPRLGLRAITLAHLVITPALAVDATGTRLGRGGGSYDRALSRIEAGTPVVALLYDDEVLPEVPAEAHDRGVSIAVTPSRVWRFPCQLDR